MKTPPTPFAGQVQTLHSWQPAFAQIANTIVDLANNLTVKNYDPRITYEAPLTGTAVVEWARYRTLEPLAQVCFLDVRLTITFGGSAASRFFLELPIPPIREDNPITLKGTVAEGGAPITVTGRNTGSAETAFLIMQKESGANWTVPSTVLISLNGWYDYGR